MLMTQTAVSALDDPNQQLYHNTVTSRHGRFSATATSAGSFQPSTIDRRLPSSSGQAYSAQNSTDPASLDATSIAGRDSSSHDPFYSNITQPPLMNAIAGSAPVGAMYVRALYDYEADDRTSLSFHEGDIIQVITQLESGWWDGVINGVRGWFPSNYCQIIVSPDEIPEPLHNAEAEHADDEPEDGDVYEEGFEEDEGSDHDDFQALPLQETEGDKSRADYWIPQATSDGRLFYYNTMTGESSMELPLESPSSVTETGPRDRMNAHMPDKTRPPPELMARGLMTDEEDSDVNSASEIDGENIMMKSRSSVARTRRSYAQQALSPSVSMDSINGQSPVTRNGRTDTFSTAPTPVNGATSFTATPFNLPTAATIPRSFFDDGAQQPLTWSRLVSNMKKAVDRYRDAITAGNRSEYVARAEDISDHLRLLLAAGSGTTDNHSGQPSIISSNKALYPHFRDMMSKFSKLVISSHIASADWPNAESVQKCLQEADGVLLGVYSYVEIARQQRGEEIPRLFPGFVIGSHAGGSWQNNGLGPRDPITSNFLDDDEGANEPTAILDGKLLERIDELKRMLVASIRELDKNLMVNDKIITPYKHELIGNNVCLSGGRVVDMFKPWISLIEMIDLSPLGNSIQTPQLADFSMTKQSLYDNISDLVLGCQAVAGPIADEWAEVRGHAFEERLEYVRQCARALESNSSQISYALQLLSESEPIHSQQQIRYQQQQQQQQQQLMQAQMGQRPPEQGFRDDMQQREQLRRMETTPYERTHQRQESRGMVRPPLVTSQSFSVGDGDGGLARNYTKGDPAKLAKIFGTNNIPGMAPPQPAPVVTPVDEKPYLRLDYDHELSWDLKVQPPTVKGGSLIALVEQLTRHDRSDFKFNNTFLLTYRSFTTARELFEMLIRRFNTQPPEGLTQAEYEEWREQKQKLIRVRVVNNLRTWLDQYWMEEQTEETKLLIRDIYNFARETVKSTETSGAAPLMAVIDQRLSGKEVGRRMIQTVSQNAPAPIMPRNMKKLKFLDIDVTEFARQLTIMRRGYMGGSSILNASIRCGRRMTRSSQTQHPMFGHSSSTPIK